jgi:hypothetical protein
MAIWGIKSSSAKHLHSLSLPTPRSSTAIDRQAASNARIWRSGSKRKRSDKLLYDRSSAMENVTRG